MALNDGHVPFHIGAEKYDKGDGEKQERIEYSIRHAAREVERLTSSIMEVNNILPSHVRRIDLTTGGDHGKGALQLGIQW